MTNDEPQPVAALFPKTMAALEACSVPLGVRLVAFGKQLPHTALHWHSDGRNYMLTAHIPLAGPTVCGDAARTPPFGPPRLDIQLPAAEAREGACGMILSPLLAPPRRRRLLRWLGAAVAWVWRGQDPWSRAAIANAQAFTDKQAVSRSWTRPKSSDVGDDMSGDLTGDLTGEVSGDLNGDVSGDTSGEVSEAAEAGEGGAPLTFAPSIFDTSFQHTAYNDGDTMADILFIDFYHPELTQEEEAAVRILQQLLRAKGEAAYAPV